MYQTKKGNQWFLGLKAHIGSDAESGLVHTMVGAATNISEVTQGHELLHGKEEQVVAHAGYQEAEKHPEATGVKWNVTLRSGKRKALNQSTVVGKIQEGLEKFKARIRANVESFISHRQERVRTQEGSLPRAGQ